MQFTKHGFVARLTHRALLFFSAFMFMFSQSGTQLSDDINQLIQSEKLPGMVLMIVKNKETLHHRAYGFADIEKKIPMKTNAIFRLFSMTKPFTSVGFLKFSEQQKISLTDYLQTYYPEFKTQPPIPLKNILSHTAGFSYGFNIRRWAGYRYLFSGIGRSETLPEFMGILSGLPLFWEPGTRWRYSYSSDVLGAFIQKIGAQPLEDYMGENIFKPLKMESTGFYITEENKERLVPMYSENVFTKGFHVVDEDPSELFEKPKGVSGGSGAFSTAADYMKFLQLLQYPEDYEHILTSSLIKEMLTNQLEGFEEKTIPERYYGNSGYGYGVGVKLKEDGYLSKGSFYWAGLGGTIFWVDPKEHLAVVAMLQVHDGRKELEQKLIPMVYNWLNSENKRVKNEINNQRNISLSPSVVLKN